MPSPLTAADVAAALTALPVGRVEVVERTGSTSSDLVVAVTADPGAWPDRSVLVADHQAAGRGRAGRTWQTPPGAALTASVLLRPAVPLTRWGWVPLLAGLAAVRALRALCADAVLKWPNDVLVTAPDGAELAGWGARRKVAGVLADLVALPGAGHGVVVGVGINVAQRADELPVPSATSLALVTGDEPDRVALLRGLLGELVALDDAWRAADGDAATSGLAAACADACATLGAAVVVERPGSAVLEGRATGLGDEGALEVTDAEGRVHTVLAGDVHHLRALP